MEKGSMVAGVRNNSVDHNSARRRQHEVLYLRKTTELTKLCLFLGTYAVLFLIFPFAVYTVVLRAETQMTGNMPVQSTFHINTKKLPVVSGELGEMGGKKEANVRASVPPKCEQHVAREI